MSDRSAQAAELGRHLSRQTGVEVTLSYISAAWNVQWAGGPTRPKMGELIALALEQHPRHFGLLQGRELTTTRYETPRMFAARAVAARRHGTLVQAVTQYAGRYRELGVDVGGRVSPEYLALTNFLETLVEKTERPEELDDPEDGPVVEELLQAGGNTLPGMVRVLLNELLAPEPGEPPQLRAVPGPDAEAPDGQG